MKIYILSQKKRILATIESASLAAAVGVAKEYLMGLGIEVRLPTRVSAREIKMEDFDKNQAFYLALTPTHLTCEA